MTNHCFWILTNGALVTPDSLHIQAVVSAPHAFGETPASIEATFAEYGESPLSNVESKSRIEVLRRVIRRNHIRIRKNQTKKCQHWSVQLFALTEERRAAIAVWAHYVAAHTSDKQADVCLHQHIDDTRMIMGLDQLAATHTGTEPTVVLSQAELLHL